MSAISFQIWNDTEQKNRAAKPDAPLGLGGQRPHDFLLGCHTISEVKKMKEDEKKPITWEIADPKPPVIQSGRMESHREN